jgi:hypothetical protein
MFHNHMASMTSYRDSFTFFNPLKPKLNCILFKNSVPNSKNPSITKTNHLMVWENHIKYTAHCVGKMQWVSFICS